VAALYALFALNALLVLATAVALGYAVYLDATAREAPQAAGLGVAAGILAMPVVPLYLLGRGRLGDRDSPERTERLTRTVALGGLLTVVLAAVVSPPDPVTQLLVAAAALLPSFGIAYLLVGR
jgi:hypothetical protein